MSRSAMKCPTRSKLELDTLDELNAVEWLPILPGVGWQSIGELRDFWSRHGDRILPHYLAQRPGTRPMAMYVIGTIPMPPIKNQPTQHSLRVTIGGTTFFSPWHYWGELSDDWYAGAANWGEREYLRGLGIVDAAEYRKAEAWIDDRNYEPGRRIRTYETLADA